MRLARLLLVAASATAATTVDITDYGAVGDGVADDTPSILASMDACKSSEPPCSIEFPGVATGGTPAVYLATSSLNMTSFTTWNIAAGATLQFALDETAARWSHPVDGGDAYVPLIVGVGVADFSIRGSGVIDGGGITWWPARPSGTGPANGVYPPLMFNCNYCTRLTLQGVTFRNSPFWTIRPVRCNHVHMEDIIVDAPIDSPNTDGIDPDSCTNVLIEGCTVGCGDDHVSVKSSVDGVTGIKWPSANITVRNMRYLQGQGLTIGSAVSGDVRNVSFENSTMVGGLVGVRIKAVRTAGGVIEDVRYTNLQLRAVGILMSMNLNFHHESLSASLASTAGPPRVTGLKLTNITGWGEASALLSCLPEAPCAGITLTDVFSDGTSEVCQDYRCDYVFGTCTNCGAEPGVCPGLDRQAAVAQES